MKPILARLFFLVLFQFTVLGAEPVSIIFDTDMDSDCDDAGALAMLHAMADQGELKILATPVSARHPWSGPCVDAINTYFGRPDIPIGLPSSTPNQQESRFAETIAKEFEHDFPSGGEAPNALDVYRKTLAEQPDRSVILVTVGDVTNVRDLLASEADHHSPLSGKQLAEKKVKRWVCMGSRYPADLDPKAWGNFKMDPRATEDAINSWPGEIIFTGGGDFAKTLSTGSGLAGLPKNNPTRRVYELYFRGKIKDRHSADQIALMVAVRGAGDPWKLVKSGHNHIFPDGRHQWKEIPDNPDHSYVSALVEDADPETVAAEMEILMRHTPARDTWKRE